LSGIIYGVYWGVQYARVMIVDLKLEKWKAGRMKV